VPKAVIGNSRLQYEHNTISVRSTLPRTGSHCASYGIPEDPVRDSSCEPQHRLWLCHCPRSVKRLRLPKVDRTRGSRRRGLSKCSKTPHHNRRRPCRSFNAARDNRHAMDGFCLPSALRRERIPSPSARTRYLDRGGPVAHEQQSLKVKVVAGSCRRSIDHSSSPRVAKISHTRFTPGCRQTAPYS